MFVRKIIELVLAGSVGLFELLLFFVAFFNPAPLLIAILLGGIGLIYILSILSCHNLSREPFNKALLTNFSLPLFFLLFYIISPDTSTKIAIIAFSSQGIIKTIYQAIIEGVC